MRKCNTDKKVFFITGGGTGGHIYPAISIINELLAIGVDKSSQIFYIGNKKNLEFQITKDNGLNFFSVPVSGMPRKLSLKLFTWIFSLVVAVFKSLIFAIKHKPNVVFATGGYVCAPMVIVAKLLKIPYVMHDSDARPGIVTRAFSKGAYGINLAFEDAKGFLKTNKIQVNGNPVRRSFFELSKEAARSELGLNNEFTVLIMGGSQGAKSINNAAIEAINHFKDKENFKLILQTGKKNFDEVMTQIPSIPHNAEIHPYFENMQIPIVAADLIVARAGSLSISEIVGAGQPSILVPYPHAAADHQRFNARNMEKLGASIYVEDADLTGDKLVSLLSELMNDKTHLLELKNAAKSCAKPDATQNILNLILDAAGA